MPFRRPIVFSFVILLFLLRNASAEQYRISEEASPALRAYLEQALAAGKPEQARRIEQARKEIVSAEAKLAEVRKQFRKMKAKESDIKSAETEVASAKKRLAEVQTAPPLSLGALSRFDQPGAIGILPQGLGISRVVDGKSALIYPFIERSTGAAEGKVFTNNEHANKEVVPTGRPLLLLNVDTATFEQGQRLAADQAVYQVGKTRVVDDETYYTLERIDISAYLIRR